MPNHKQKLLARKLGKGEFSSHAQRRRMEEHVRRSSVKMFGVVVFDDSSAMALSEFQLLSNPELHAQDHGGVFAKNLVSYEGFKDVVGQAPEIPEHLATPEQLQSLTQS